MSWSFLELHDRSAIDGRFMEAEHWTAQDDWPAAWIDVTVKTYPRFPLLALPDRPWIPQLTLGEALEKRRSARQPTAVTRLDHINTLLRESLRVWETPENPGARRVYPSAGARFPVEAYLLWNRDTDLRAGLYHYRPIDHCLETIGREPMRENLRSLFGHDWIADSTCVLVLTSEFSRSAVKYGPRSYRFALLEAGHVMQNLLLVAADLGIAVAPVGGFADDRVNRLLDLGRTDERALYCLVAP